MQFPSLKGMSMYTELTEQQQQQYTEIITQKEAAIDYIKTNVINGKIIMVDSIDYPIFNFDIHSQICITLIETINAKKKLPGIVKNEEIEQYNIQLDNDIANIKTKICPNFYLNLQNLNKIPIKIASTNFDNKVTEFNGYLTEFDKLKTEFDNLKSKYIEKLSINQQKLNPAAAPSQAPSSAPSQAPSSAPSPAPAPAHKQTPASSAKAQAPLSAQTATKPAPDLGQSLVHQGPLAPLKQAAPPQADPLPQAKVAADEPAQVALTPEESAPAAEKPAPAAEESAEPAQAAEEPKPEVIEELPTSFTQSTPQQAEIKYTIQVNVKDTKYENQVNSINIINNTIYKNQNIELNLPFKKPMNNI